MKTIATAILTACLSMSAVSAFAQDAMSKDEAKKTMSMQDCKDRAKTAAGVKRNEALPNADIDSECAKMMKHGKHKMKKNDMTHGDGTMTPDAPAAPPAPMK